jgi:hypothetical protein
MLCLGGVRPLLAQAINGITSPAAGDTLTGVVTVQGTAVHPDYLRYELAFLAEANQAAGWIVFAEGTEPVVNGTLAVWDTTVGQAVGAPVFPDGRYQLRLRVVRRDYNYDEYFVTNLTIRNEGPTPEPTADATAVSLTATANALQPPAASTAAPGGIFTQPTPLPSLTPFPTPTTQATPQGNVAAGSSNRPADAEEGGGLLGQMERIDSTQFGLAFWRGVRWSLALFFLLAFYLLVRNIARWLWRKYWAQKS